MPHPTTSSSRANTLLPSCQGFEIRVERSFVENRRAFKAYLRARSPDLFPLRPFLRRQFAKYSFSRIGYLQFLLAPLLLVIGSILITWCALYWLGGKLLHSLYVHRQMWSFRRRLESVYRRPEVKCERGMRLSEEGFQEAIVREKYYRGQLASFEQQWTGPTDRHFSVEALWEELHDRRKATVVKQLFFQTLRRFLAVKKTEFTALRHTEARGLSTAFLEYDRLIALAEEMRACASLFEARAIAEEQEELLETLGY